MREVIFNQSGAELRMQGGGIGSETWKRGPRFPREGGWTQESVLGGKIATGRESLGSFSWISTGT